MILYPPAKINIGLYVINKRLDGYHNLESVMIPVPLYDILELQPADNFSFSVSGIPIPGNPDTNLCVKAFHLMKEKYAVANVAIHLHKIIPMGAGIGGGSANAAFVLKGLNELFSMNLAVKELEELAAQLGSDCPFFITDTPKFIEGRGEIMQEISLSLKGYFLKLINDGTHVSTADAFANLIPSDSPNYLTAKIQLPLKEWQGKIENDFEKTIFSKYPNLKAHKDRLLSEGAVYASMSGSGSSVYGIFEGAPDRTFGEDVTEVILEFDN